MSAVAVPASNGVITVDTASLLISPKTLPPSDGASWQDVTLPDMWPRSRYAQGDNGWYRIAVHLERVPQESWAIYVPRLNMNAAVYLNGYHLGDGGRFEEPMARNWMRPLYFEALPEHWRAGENVVHVRLKSYPGYGRLGQIRVGPESILRPTYETHAFIQSDLNVVLCFATLVASIFMFSLWLRRRQDTMYLWFALTALEWSLYSLNTFIKYIPVSARAWDWFIYSGTAWWTVLLAVFSHRIAGINRPRLEAAFLIWAGLSTLAYVLSGLPYIRQTTVIWQVGSIVIGAIVVGELLLHRNSRDWHVKALAVGIGVVLLTGVHDWMIQSEIIEPWWAYGSHILQYAAPVLMLYIAWYLSGRFVRALNESEALNLQLEDRITAARRELESSYRNLRQMELRQAAATERERITRDLHDGLGGIATNIGMLSDLAQREQSLDAVRGKLARISNLAQESVTEIRGFMHNLDDGNADWESLPADVRLCGRRTLEPHDIELDFNAAVTPDAPFPDTATRINLFRTYKEALTNIVKHANAKRVRVELNATSDALGLIVEDNGAGFDSTPSDTARIGRGLRNLKTRAQELGGVLEITSAPGAGTRVALTLPLVAAGV